MKITEKDVFGKYFHTPYVVESIKAKPFVATKKDSVQSLHSEKIKNLRSSEKSNLRSKRKSKDFLGS